MAAFQFETAYAIVQLFVAQCVHESIGALQPEVAACLALKVRFAVDGQWLQVAAVWHDDTSAVVHLQLAVLPVDSLLAANLYVCGYQTLGSRRLYAL